VHLNPDHVPALHNLATVYERTGRPEEARSCYQRVQELTPHLGSIDAARNARYGEEYLLQ
ncbi:MAG: tetratricopeptide repeat protein, partial [Gemmatimonadota bacterium]